MENYDLPQEIEIQTQEGTVKVLNLQPSTSRKLALIDLDTLKRLTNHLPSVGFNTIKQVLVEKILEKETLPELVEEIRKEYNFHKTVNLIDSYTHKETRSQHESHNSR